MSKQVDATLECGRCRHTFVVSLYRTLWIEYLENRDLIFSDKLNVFDCPQCGFVNRVDFPIMATNAPRHFAVWYEPYRDPQIDVDRQSYVEVLGEGNYFAEAPRESDWEIFKATILDFEEGRRVGREPREHNPSKLPLPKKKSGVARFFRRKAD